MEDRELAMAIALSLEEESKRLQLEVTNIPPPQQFTNPKLMH